MKRFLTMQVIGFSWRNPDTLAPWKPHKKPHFRRGQTQAWTWQRALENGLTHCHWAKECDPQAFLTEEEKARGVKGAWLIVEALGEELDVSRKTTRLSSCTLLTSTESKFLSRPFFDACFFCSRFSFSCCAPASSSCSVTVFSSSLPR